MTAQPTMDNPTKAGAGEIVERLGYHNMGSRGRCDWTHLREAVAEATSGSRAHSTPFDPAFYPGHQMVEGANYNSLDRIVTAFVDAALTSQQSEITRLTQEVEAAREALERIASGQAFREQRFAEDDDADYFLRCQRRVQQFARATLTGHPTKEPGNAEG